MEELNRGILVTGDFFLDPKIIYDALRDSYDTVALYKFHTKNLI